MQGVRSSGLASFRTDSMDLDRLFACYAYSLLHCRQDVFLRHSTFGPGNGSPTATNVVVVVGGVLVVIRFLS